MAHVFLEQMSTVFCQICQVPVAVEELRQHFPDVIAQLKHDFAGELEPIAYNSR